MFLENTRPFPRLHSQAQATVKSRMAADERR
jgi:hypothetical protein